MHGAEKAPGASGIPAAPGMAAATPNTPDASPRLEPALLRPSRRRVWAAAHHLPATLQQLEPRLLMAADVVYALNAGGPGFTDGNGVVWVADAGFANPNAGNFTASTTQPINLSDPSVPAGTDAQLFQTERWDPSSGEDLTYSLAVDNGDYEVDLYFADIFSGTQGVGERVFDIVLEGQTVADDFDVVAAAGGGFTGIVETYSVAVSDGTIDLQFLHEVENPALKAILVRSVAVDPVDPPTPNVIAPYIDLNGFLPGIDTDTTFVVGQGPINVTPPDAGLADGDTDVASLTVTIVGNPDGDDETLDADLTGTNLTKSYANGVLTISGVAAFEVYQDVLRTITYDNTANPADGSTRTLAFAASDGELNSNSPVANITIQNNGSVDPPTPNEIAPYIDLNGFLPGIDTEATFVVGDGPINVTPSDAGLADGDTDVVSLTVTIVDNPSGPAETLDADVSGTGLTKAYADGVLTISGVAAFEVYQSVLRTVTYDNAASPADGETRTLAFAASDGKFGSNSPVATITIENDGVADPVAPTLDLNGGLPGNDAAVDFTAGEGPVDLAAAATIADLDSATLASLFVTLDAFPDGLSEVLSADVTGTTIGASFAGGMLMLSGVASVADYQAVLRTVTYDNLSANPSLSSRTLTVVANDGQLDSIPATITIDVSLPTPNVIAPYIDLNGFLPGIDTDTTFVVGGGPINVTPPDAGLADGDTDVASLTVTIVGNPDGANETLDADLTGTNLTKAYANGVLTISGVAAFEVYQDVLRTITYDNTASPADGETRTLAFAASDGELNSNSPVANINIQNDGVQPQPGTLAADVQTLDFNDAQVGVVQRTVVTLTHTGAAIDDPVTITGTDFGGADANEFGDLFAQQYGDSVTLNPGQSIELTFFVLPQTIGAKTASVVIVQDGATPLTLDLQASAIEQVAPDFETSFIDGLDVTSPTTLQWGPDNRLYVGTLDGLVVAYTITRNGPNDYAVTDTQTIDLVQQIPNHNDDGTLNPGVNTRLITGLYVGGTADDPVLYVGSSDPRLTSGTGSITDTNSGIISQLTQNPDGSWTKVDLVRGLPRSAVDHAVNGLQMLEESNTLLVAVGGLTNAGAPGNFFGNLPEYALSAAVVSLDLDALNALPTLTDANGQQYKYNLPTLDDEDRPTNNDANDPFGGNGGQNQAILEENGPVDIFAAGLRNPYDLVVTQSGLIYATDNGPNSSIGGVPILDGDGQPTNQPNQGGVSAQDALHLISEGSYSGHPNPTRANTNNTFNDSNPQSPVYAGYTEPGTYTANGDDDALSLFGSSTNGITEYTATGFGGALNGDVLVVSITGQLTRLKLSADGTQVIQREVLFNSAGGYPLDVTAVGDDHPFAGTIWVTDLFAGPGSAVRVYEPDAGSGQGNPNDLDGDGYTNQDEIDNGTNPNSAGDVPADNDGDFTSDLNDADDDNDLIDDLNDPFQIDDTNGSTVDAPFVLSFDNDDLNRGGLLDLGFTGLMTNGTTDYLDQFDTANLTAGSAAGVLTIDAVGTGTALGSANTQDNAFQFGVNLDETSPAVVIQTNIDSVFDNAPGGPAAGQRAGIYFGTGDQDNYVSVFVEGDGTINTVVEVNGQATFGTPITVGPNFTDLNLYLTVDPATQTIQAAYAYGSDAAVNVGGPVGFPTAWLQNATAPAVGVIATAGENGEAYSVTYDFLRVDPAPTPPVPQTPFNGTPFTVGQRVEAEEFDLGGNGVAYLDLSVDNEGSSAFRPDTAVDFEATGDAGGGVNVGWIEAGEYLEYTFDIENAGTYTADFRVALAAGTGGSFHLEIDGQNVSGPIALPVTGGWQNWQTVTSDEIQLDQGPVTLRVAFDTASTGRFVGNFNWLQLNYESPFEGDPPTVSAGADTAFAGPGGSTALNGTVADDSTNNVPLRTYWNLVTGPAAVTFDDPYAVDTNASFTEPGVYILRLSADNGIGGVISDDVRVTVSPPSSGIVSGLDVLNEDDGSTLGSLATNPLAPGDIVWNTILIDESQIKNFMGNPDGSTDSPATGSATFSYDASTNELSYEITYAGLTADLTNIHIHGPANAGTSNMAHIFDVFSGEQDVIDSGIDRRNATVTGVVNLTSHTHGGNNPTPTLAEALEALTTGQAYVNVHTTAFPMGEIRGNVPVAVPAEDPFFDLGAINATTLRFSPTTTSGVDTVRYFLNGVELTDGSGPGREVTWQATTGDHVLVAIPSDGQNDGPAMTFRFSVEADPGETRVAGWQPLADSPYAQFEGQGIAAGGKLYLFGGFINGGLQVTDRFAVYDPALDTWTDLADVPLELTHANHVVDGDNIYVLGGYVGTHPGGSTDAVWVYNIPTDTWSAGPALPEDRAGAGVAILGRTLYFFGGATRTQGSVASTVDHGDVWTLDLGATTGTGDDAATWNTGTVADMPEPRNHMAGVELNGFVYAIGGQVGEDEFNGNSSSVHRYDPTTNTWTSVADLPIEIGHITASTFTANGRIFVVTGVTQNSVSTDTVFMYDPGTDTWTALPPAPVASQSPVAAYIDGKIYLTGGDDSPGGISNKTYVLDLNNTWANLASLPAALGEVAAGVIGDKLYVVGDGNDGTYAYDFGTGEWTSGLAQRPVPAKDQLAEVVDGKLYVFGGIDYAGGRQTFNDTQIYDPATDTWTAGTDVPINIFAAQTTVIDGKIYLSGGVDNSDQTTNATYVYDPADGPGGSWTQLADAPLFRNSAAVGTDGQKMYIFGGRIGGDAPGNGFTSVMIYDPATDTWESSEDPGSTIAELPQRRGGIVNAPFIDGEFYVTGGETDNDPNANGDGLFDRVDIYDPVTNTWRQGSPMLTPRHGHYPVAHAGAIYIPGGGVAKGPSNSNVFEVYYPNLI